MDNQHQQIKGYRDFDQKTVDMINTIKEAEKDIGALWQQIAQEPTVDGRNVAIAKTLFEDAFSRLVRSVAQPEDVYGQQPRRA